ncbi:hypothetical protein [Dactylosporangium sp. CS-033363]|uniref:hypothetical protein n=1 Tax=Dactylosporangium sp. CS-033363 TaxID=3239935 RepID=UPI003D8C646B
MSPDLENPILYVEEIRRFPLLPRRALTPGTVAVYRKNNGRLVTFPGALTAGEMFFRGVRVVYEVDVTEHPFEAEIRVACGTETVSVHVVATWTVVDPVPVVERRLTYVPQTCLAELRVLLTLLAGAVGATGLDGFRIAVAAGLPTSVPVADGVLLRRVSARVRALPALQRVSAGALETLAELLLQDEDGTPSVAAIGDAWQEVHDIAEAGRRALAGTDPGQPDDERDQAVALAVDRFSALTGTLRRQFDGLTAARAADD